MLGAGGRIVLPVSETDALTSAIADITHGNYRGAIDTLKLLRAQVGAGYHANPYKSLEFVGTLSDDVHSVAYTHHHDGKDYRHNFQKGSASLIAIVRHGKRDLILTSAEGVPLWDEF
jgi:hypothetical protein